MNVPKLFESVERVQILVLGDLILDRYTWGNTDRVSPEASVLVLDAQTQEVRLGGAASVAGLARSLDAQIAVAGVVGNDTQGKILRKLLDKADIDHRWVLCDSTRPTTCKERFMGRAVGRHPHQILRVDHEIRKPLDVELEHKLVDHIVARLGDYRAILISDYNKGVCTPTLLKAVITAASEHDLPVIVDPAKIDNYARYRGATLLTPNRAETELATGGRTIDTPDDALKAGFGLCEYCHAEALLVTLDSQGMVLAWKNKKGQTIPTKARAVYDITGAGDMVLAVVGIGLALGTPLAESVRLANLAAGMEVERMGVSPLNRDELQIEQSAGSRMAVSGKLLRLDRMVELAESYHRVGKKIVFTNGCFDLLHAGHTACLEEAARLGDVLIVAINSDRSVRRLKGSGRPTIPQEHRAALLASLASVDHVLIFDDDTPEELLRRLQPDVLVKGGTCPIDEVVGRSIVESQGGRVCMTRKKKGISTTQILDAIHGVKPHCKCGSSCRRNSTKVPLKTSLTIK